MSQFSAASALEPNVQFIDGWDIRDRVGTIKAPLTGTYNDGHLYKVAASGLNVETCGDNDAIYIGEQPVAAAGPIASAATREQYTQGIPQNIVANDAEMTLMPIGGGRAIRTNNYATGSDTGAILAGTAIGTALECYNGSWRQLQSGNNAIGEIRKGIDARSMIEIFMY